MGENQTTSSKKTPSRVSPIHFPTKKATISNIILILITLKTDKRGRDTVSEFLNKYRLKNNELLSFTLCR